MHSWKLLSWKFGIYSSSSSGNNIAEILKQSEENIPEVDFQQHGLNVPTSGRRGSNR